MFGEKEYKKEELEEAVKIIRGLDESSEKYQDAWEFEDKLFKAYETNLINQDEYEELKDILSDYIVDMMDDLDNEDFDSDKK